MTFDYQAWTIDQHLAAVKAELGHREQLQQALSMWQGFSTWLGLAQAEIENRREPVGDGWTDGAHTEVDGRLVRSRDALGAWVTQIKDSGVVQQLTDLPNLISTTYSKVEFAKQRRDWALRGYRYTDVLSAGSRPDPHVSKLSTPQMTEELVTATADSVRAMNELGQAYANAAKAMTLAVGGLLWPGPRAGESETTLGPDGGVSPDAGSANGPAGTPDPESAPESPQETPNPATTPETTPTESTDPTKDASDVASALSDLAEALTGSGTTPDPVTSPLPTDLGDVINPDTVPGVASGLPGLAGVGSAVEGGVVADAVARAAVPTTTAGPAVTPLPTGLTAATAATGGYPPMYPPHAAAAAAKRSGGIKPGTSEQPVSGRPRDRRAAAAPGAAGVPGVALRGRRSGATKPAPAAQRRWDAEDDTIRLLDEEMWQVDQHDDVAEGRTPRRGS
ncbi:hypothetical protein HDA40_001639 [Hamadaea flava]|uniref:PPE family protein n=1 Tax=Hamadaea flava TaxID=1742688 RepID=A0ABV8LP06_9ACTN|nr:hypothetical protein [Hamadaea flava]MCP2323132.1 hypothetical protein [Hamadaea flava]